MDFIDSAVRAVGQQLLTEGRTYKNAVEQIADSLERKKGLRTKQNQNQNQKEGQMSHGSLLQAAGQQSLSSGEEQSGVVRDWRTVATVATNKDEFDTLARAKLRHIESHKQLLYKCEPYLSHV